MRLWPTSQRYSGKCYTASATRGFPSPHLLPLQNACSLALCETMSAAPRPTNAPLFARPWHAATFKSGNAQHHSRTRNHTPEQFGATQTSKGPQRLLGFEQRTSGSLEAPTVRSGSLVSLLRFVPWSFNNILVLGTNGFSFMHWLSIFADYCRLVFRALLGHKVAYTSRFIMQWKPLTRETRHRGNTPFRPLTWNPKCLFSRNGRLAGTPTLHDSMAAQKGW